MAANVEAAIDILREEIYSTGNSSEIEYFEYHEKRYLRMAKSIADRLPKGSLVLDVGSHYLHSSIILKKLGYELYAVDVSAFWDIEFIQKRLKAFDIKGVAEDNLESFESIGEWKNRFDCVLFTEIMEHITFNPVHFWSQVYNSIKDGGFVYVTTPNSFALPNVLRTFRNLFLFKGIGIKVEDIFHHVTYGHHWKEYSNAEMKAYFRTLSDDFTVKCYYFSFHKMHDGSFRNKLWQSLIIMGSKLHFLAPCLEGIVVVRKKQGIKLDPPKYY